MKARYRFLTIVSLIISMLLLAGCAGSAVSVTSASVNNDGHLILTLSNGQTIDAGNVVGPAGPQGIPGPQGLKGDPGPQGPPGTSAITGDTNGTDTTTPSSDTTTPSTPSSSGGSYDNPGFPVIWVSIEPPEGVSGAGTEVTVTLKVPPGALVSLHFFNPVTGTDSRNRPPDTNADTDGNVVLTWAIHTNAAVGEATLEVTVTKTDGTKIVVTHPYILK